MDRIGRPLKPPQIVSEGVLKQSKGERVRNNLKGL